MQSCGPFFSFDPAEAGFGFAELSAPFGKLRVADRFVAEFTPQSGAPQLSNFQIFKFSNFQIFCFSLIYRASCVVWINVFK
jgi:hypothetical protein